jgi:hypothetical protein
VQLLGAVIVAAAALFASAAFFWRRIPWPVRRLGALGVMVSASSIGAFLVSVMPADHWSTRYVAPIVFVLPYTFAPLVYALPRRIGALVLAPYLITVAVGGWMSYGLDYRKGPWPESTAVGRGDEERDLALLLNRRGIKVGAAQYWLAYRLTFLFREKPIIVPSNPGNDRYPPYQQLFASAPDVAYIVHPSMPWISPADQERELVARGARYERLTSGRYTVFIEHR